jgi:hypothetical protein
MTEENIEIDIRQLIISEKMSDTLKENGINIIRAQGCNISENQFIVKEDGSFQLARLENIMSLPEELIPPISVKNHTNASGNKMRVTIDGEKKALYDIIDGRHRVVRAILNGNNKITIKNITKTGGKSRKYSKKYSRKYNLKNKSIKLKIKNKKNKK